MILADSLLLAEASMRKFLSLEPLFPISEPWQWLLLILATIGALAFIIAMYVFDGVELPTGITVLLGALRVVALLGLIAFFLNPGIRSEKRIVKNSRVPVLVDTSLSMGLRDTSGSASDANAPSRIEQVVGELANGELITKLREQHDVLVYRFDQEAKPAQIASYSKVEKNVADEGELDVVLQRREEALRQSRVMALMSIGVLVVSLAFGVAFFVLLSRQRTAGNADSWLLFACVVFLIGSFVILAIADLRSSDVSLSVVLGLAADNGEVDEDAADEEDAVEEVVVDWNNALLPRGTETRLGDAVRYIVTKERGGPIAGIVVFTDGRNNNGIDHGVASSVASDARIPIYAVGMGSIERPKNVRVVDVEAPPRAHRDDKFHVSGLLQSFGMENTNVKVQLVSTREDDTNQGETAEGEKIVELGVDGKEISVRFEVEPVKETGRRIYKLRVQAPEEDRNDRDNENSAVVDIVEHKTRVLLIAGGPTREFRFLRSQLYRGEDADPVVWLQSGQPGMEYAKGREELIFEFPDNEDDLFKFDCIIAFDPDWRVLTKDQTDMLDRWISEMAGGLIVVTGPVYTPLWTSSARNDQRMNTMRALYPVSFFNQGSATIRIGRFGGEEAWPLKFTREGRSAEFLWVEETAEKSKETWEEFEGVYGYYAVNEPKPGATVYARFSDPDTAAGPDDELPIYLAGHFYGAGRVFFQASGEMWRVRAVSDKYFENYYTKLIRWASQGRLLHDALRGVLLVDKDRCLLGDHVEVRAILNDARHQPLTDESVTASLIEPDSAAGDEPIKLTLMRVKNSAREGTYAAQFTALKDGEYRIVLPLPDYRVTEIDPDRDLNKGILTREVRVRIPDKEIQNSQRDDVVLNLLASQTGGKYYQGIGQADGEGAEITPVYDAIEPQDQTSYLPGTPDANFTTKLMGWLLGIICSVLAVEWLIRRLSKLA